MAGLNMRESRRTDEDAGVERAEVHVCVHMYLCLCWLYS